MSLHLTAEHRRWAGLRRKRRAEELIDFLDRVEPGELRGLLEIIKRPIAGASQQIATVVANASLTTTPTTIIGGILGVAEEPLVLALGYVGNTTGLAAGANALYSIRRTDTPAILQSGVATNSGAGAAAVGPAFVLAIVPFGIPAANGVDMQGSVSSGTGTAVAAATTPIILAVVGVA
jgi:hypothetical protein